MRVFRPVGEIVLLAMVHTREHLPLGGTIAAELICDDAPREIGQALQQLAEASLRRVRVSPTSHQDVEHVAVSIDGPPEIVPFAVDAEKDFDEVPRITRSGAAMPTLVQARLPELPAPVAHRFIGEDDAAFCHQLLDIPIAQTKTKVEPDTMADDRCREPMPLIRGGSRGWIHVASMA
jgi:hypothetical protein